MSLISVTRLRIRSVRFMPAFLFHTWTSVRQLKRAVGFVGGALASSPERTFWTVTVWTDEAAMRAYRNAAAHMRAMPKLLDWCSEASVTHWEQGGGATPEAAEAQRRMIAEGRLSKVRRPSAAHAAGRIPDEAPPRVSLRIEPQVRPRQPATR